MATAAAKKASRVRAMPKRQYWKVNVYPLEYGGEPDKRVIVTGPSFSDALNQVQHLFPDNGRLSAEKVRPAERYKAVTRDSVLVERA